LTWYIKGIPGFFGVVVHTIKSSQLIAPTHSLYCSLAVPEVSAINNVNWT